MYKIEPLFGELYDAEKQVYLRSKVDVGDKPYVMTMADPYIIERIERVLSASLMPVALKYTIHDYEEPAHFNFFSFFQDVDYLKSRQAIAQLAILFNAPLMSRQTDSGVFFSGRSRVWPVIVNVFDGRHGG